MFDYYGGGYGTADTAVSAIIICLILAIIGGFVVLFAFLPESKERKYQGFSLWAYKVLNFKKMFSMSLLKLLYSISFIFITLMGIVTLFSESFIGGLLFIIFGNFVVRITYEFLLLFFSIHDNLTQINRNTSSLVKDDTTPANPAAKSEEIPYNPEV